jgi:hypothetical protein
LGALRPSHATCSGASCAEHRPERDAHMHHA